MNQNLQQLRNKWSAWGKQYIEKEIQKNVRKRNMLSGWQRPIGKKKPHIGKTKGASRHQWKSTT